jgi:tRNA U34 2-thiouridine synthase MnmA/TrmU
MAKAVLLLSGGLDSTLAGKLLLELGIEVEAITFVSPFHLKERELGNRSAAHRAAEQLGYGRGVNPCIDCRIFRIKQAGEYMKETGADFMATGEVLGQRPMSQKKHQLDLIEKMSGFTGYILRPLCAKLLSPTIPEQRGIIDREKLKAIQGRTRQRQIALAKELGITDYPNPGGGCLLTDVEYAARFKDLLKHEPDATLNSTGILFHGRHFRLPGGAKAVVGKNETDNLEIERSALDDDVLLEPIEIAGPTVLCRGIKSPEDIKTAAALLVSYTKSKAADVKTTKGPDSIRNTVMKNVESLDKAQIEEWRICARQTKSKNK